MHLRAARPRLSGVGPTANIAGSLQGWTHERLTLALLERVSSGHIMVESSKTPWNSLAAPSRLHRKLGADFQLLHIVRDPRAVSWSAIKKAGRKGKHPLMALRAGVAALSWSLSNLACTLFGRMHPDCYTQIRYEDLAQGPSAVMQVLFAKVVPAGCNLAPRGDRCRRELRQPHALENAHPRRDQGRSRLEKRHAAGFSRAGCRAHVSAPQELRPSPSRGNVQRRERGGRLPR